MRVAVIGTGYVGLTTGVCLAEVGHRVICVDNDEIKISQLQNGLSPIFEPGLEALLKKNITQCALTFNKDIKTAVESSEVIFICVNTPPKKGGFADLKYVEAVAREIARSIGQEYKVIVDKSTVPVKTAGKVKETIVRYGTDETKFDVISNPEFLREGTAIKDTFEADRIVVGIDSERAKNVMLALYKPLMEKGNIPIKIVSVRSAELIKHGANTFLSVKIGFANLIAHLCEEVNADALEVLEAIGMDKRIGKQFLEPGIGFGGSCFPKDISAFKRTLDLVGLDSSLIKAVEEINEWAWKRFVQKIEKELWVIDGKIIGILGIAFKPDTDDIRNSPALKIIEELKANGAHIRAYDPHAMEKAQKLIPDIEYCDDSYSVAAGSEALVLCTEWKQFKNLDFDRIRDEMVVPVVFDGRNILDPDTMRTKGFRYFGVGRTQGV